MSMIDRGYGGQHFFLSITCKSILSQIPQRENIEHINLQTTLDFSVFVHRGYKNSHGRPKRQHFNLAPQSTEASELLDKMNKCPRPTASCSKN